MPTASPEPVGDVVVVVPGIQGTQLRKNGEPVWALSGRALWNGIKTFGGNVKGLALPDDLGEEHPGDGVEPGGLMPDLHGIPGVGPFIGGYSDLSRWLRSDLGLGTGTAGEAGNLIEFGYDWRLSNRYNATQLQQTVEPALKRWRDEHNRDAKLVFYCHSMGGLLTRYYLEVLGGAEHTRTLVTVGTPHQGSLKALDNLVNGRRLGLGPLKIDVAKLARTFPSAYQLLPIYDCVVADGGLKNLSETAVPKLDARRAADGFAFHREIADAIDANGDSPYKLRLIVGTRQPTLASARLTNSGVESLLTIDGYDELGDGTVSRFASIPAELDPTDLIQVSSSQRHGWLQQSKGVLDDFHGILTAKPRRFMSDTPDLSQAPGIDLPEVLEVGQPLVVKAESTNDNLLLHASVTNQADDKTATKQLRNRRGGRYSVEFDPPAAGVYTVTVSGVKAARFAPATEAVLVAEVAPSD